MGASIYYFSATGNSFEVARDIAEKTNAGIIPIVPLAGQEVKAAADTVGIVYPVYDWNLPQVVRDFVAGLDASGAKYIFAVATCNYLPGCGLDVIAEMLKQKGQRLNAGFVIRMPGNYLPLYGANSPGIQARKFAQKNKKVKKIARTVLGGQNHRNEHSPVLFDRLLGPRFGKEVENFADKDSNFTLEPGCSGCGICAKVCPFENIAIKDGRPQWQHKCQQCMACIHYCPKECIQIGDKTKGRTRYKNPLVPLGEIMAMNRDALHAAGKQPENTGGIREEDYEKVY